MKLISAYIELFIRGESPVEMSGGMSGGDVRVPCFLLCPGKLFSRKGVNKINSMLVVVVNTIRLQDYQLLIHPTFVPVTEDHPHSHFVLQRPTLGYLAGLTVLKAAGLTVLKAGAGAASTCVVFLPILRKQEGK